MIDRRPGGRITLGADKGYDYLGFVAELRHMRVAPHVAQHITARRGRAIDARTTRSVGYARSQHTRKRIEQAFGWMNTVGGLRKLRHRCGALVEWVFTLTAAVYNIVRMPHLLAPASARAWARDDFAGRGVKVT